MLHWSFILLLIFGAYYMQRADLSKLEMQWWCLFFIAVFLCILLHEFGHALMARRFQVETKDIVLLPFGGMARLSHLPEKPVQEFLVALAGPMVNLFIAACLFPFFWLITKPQLVAYPLSSPENIDDDFFLFLPLLLFLNVLLAVFNLIPAFPMDGGRMLRAVLTIKIGRLKATRVAMFLGVVIAVGLALYGAVSGRWLYCLLGIFIVSTAFREYRWVKTESALAGAHVGDVVQRTGKKTGLEDQLKEVKVLAEQSGETGFLVVDGEGELIGTLDMSEWMEKEIQEDLYVKDCYRKGISIISIKATLKSANEMMQKEKCTVLVVEEDGLLCGVLEDSQIWRHLFEEKEKGTIQ